MSDKKEYTNRVLAELLVELHREHTDLEEQIRAVSREVAVLSSEVSMASPDVDDLGTDLMECLDLVKHIAEKLGIETDWKKRHAEKKAQAKDKGPETP